MPKVVSVKLPTLKIGLKEIFSIWPKTCCSYLAAVGPGTLHPVSGHPAVSRGGEVLSWHAGDTGIDRQCLGEEKCRNHNIYWRNIHFFQSPLNSSHFLHCFVIFEVFFWQKCFDSYILDIVSNLLGKPELSCHDGSSLLALITQSRSEGRAKLFYKWGECDHCSLHTRPHGIRYYWHPIIYPTHTSDDVS